MKTLICFILNVALLISANAHAHGGYGYSVNLACASALALYQLQHPPQVSVVASDKVAAKKVSANKPSSKKSSADKTSVDTAPPENAPAKNFLPEDVSLKLIDWIDAGKSKLLDHGYKKPDTAKKLYEELQEMEELVQAYIQEPTTEAKMIIYVLNDRAARLDKDLKSLVEYNPNA
jgi:hypothetical protein